MDVEKSLNFSVDIVDLEQDTQNVDSVQLGCWGAGSDDDSYC